MILTLTPFQNVFHWIIISQKERERQAALSLTHMELSWNGQRCSEPLMAAGQRERWRGLALGSPYLHGDSKYLIKNWVDGGDETVKTRGQWESEGWSLREDLSLLERARWGSKQEILYYHPHSVDGETEAGGVTPRLPTSPSTQDSSAHSPLLRTFCSQSFCSQPSHPAWALGQESKAQLVTHSSLCSLIHQPHPVLGEGSQKPVAFQPRRLGAIRP